MMWCVLVSKAMKMHNAATLRRVIPWSVRGWVPLISSQCHDQPRGQSWVPVGSESNVSASAGAEMSFRSAEGMSIMQALAMTVAEIPVFLYSTFGQVNMPLFIWSYATQLLNTYTATLLHADATVVFPFILCANK